MMAFPYLCPGEGHKHGGGKSMIHSIQSIQTYATHSLGHLDVLWRENSEIQNTLR